MQSEKKYFLVENYILTNITHFISSCIKDMLCT